MWNMDSSESAPNLLQSESRIWENRMRKKERITEDYEKMLLVEDSKSMMYAMSKVKKDNPIDALKNEK